MCVNCFSLVESCDLQKQFDDLNGSFNENIQKNCICKDDIETLLINTQALVRSLLNIKRRDNASNRDLEILTDRIITLKEIISHFNEVGYKSIFIKLLKGTYDEIEKELILNILRNRKPVTPNIKK